MTGAVGAGAAGAAASGKSEREPELITHRSEQGGYNYYGDDDPYEQDDEDYGYSGYPGYPGYDDYDEDGSDDGFDGPPEDEMSAAGSRKARRKTIWRRIRRTCYVGAALMFLVPTVAFAVLYFTTDVTSPAETAREYNTSISLKYNDGSLINRFSSAQDGASRVLIKDLDEVSQDMLHATMAAESADFYSNPGFSPSGIARAVLSQVTGGQGGGSTITQQYVKLSTGRDDHTLWRKFTEIVRSVKMTNQYEKDTILKAYLNTAYYGRGAYGIHNAADAYFNKTPNQLNAAESAVLAGMVQLPTGNDPRVNPEQGKNRWNYVIGQMADNGWITRDEEKNLTIPVTEPRFAWQGDDVTGPQYLLKQQVLAELERKGYTRNELASQGLQVVTTIDPKAQKAAVDAVNKVTKGQPEKIHTGLVATDPETGAIRAYYGGSAVGFDWAAAPQSPGSSFKPFVTMAGLKQGFGLGETYDGTSPQTIAGTKYANAESVTCNPTPKQCSVRDATTRSVNTAFVNMAVKFGPQKVAEAAYEAGIPREKGKGQATLAADNGTVGAGIALGAYPVSTTSMANAYGSLADGKRAEPRFISKIVDGEGQVVQQFGAEPEPAFATSAEESKNLAANVTSSMLRVAQHSGVPLADGRPVASKTGTHQLRDTGHNSKAWMVGYTPQISAAVSMGANSEKGQLPLVDSSGSDIFGSDLPGKVWQEFMNTYHQGKPIKQFPAPNPIGQFRTPAPTPTQPPTSATKPSTPTQPPTSSTQPPTSETQPPTSSTQSPTDSEENPGQECTGGIFDPPSCDEEGEQPGNRPGTESTSESDQPQQNAVGPTRRNES